MEPISPNQHDQIVYLQNKITAQIYLRDQIEAELKRLQAELEKIKSGS